MPLYEYQCTHCGHRFERIQSVAADPVSTCPECSGEVRRLIGVPALQFKGSGWYVNDYGKGNGRRAESGESTTPAAEKPSAGDSKAAEKATAPATGDSSGD